MEALGSESRGGSARRLYVGEKKGEDGILPGCAAASSLQIPDEEALLAAGSVPIYEVAVDKHGKLVAGSHRIARRRLVR